MQPPSTGPDAPLVFETFCNYEKIVVENAIKNLLHQIQQPLEPPVSPPSRCITVPKKLHLKGILDGQVWRWAHLPWSPLRIRALTVLRPHANCYAGQQMAICLNPYHYKSGGKFHNVPKLRTKEAQWASIAYYEKSSKLASFECYNISVEVSCIGPPSDKCLNLEHLSNKSDDCSISNTRRQIGSGIILHRMNGKIILELMSDSDLYIHSVFYNKFKGYSPATVCHMVSNRRKTLIIMCDNFFHKLLATEAHKGGPDAVYQLAKMCTVRLSFGQVWTTGILVTENACWLEIRFVTHLRWLSRTAAQMGAPYKLHC